jgi:hypothetical protein
LGAIFDVSLHANRNRHKRIEINDLI